MEIKFEKIDNVYVSEITITSNCNIHIEREELGMFTIESRGSKQGKYVPMEEGHYGDKYIIDVDMLGNIYPKYIKVTSISMPTYAEVNFAEQGGGSGDGITYLALGSELFSSSNILDVINYIGGMLKAKVTSISGASDTEEGDVIIFPSPMIYQLSANMSLEPIGVGLCLSDMICMNKQQVTVESALKELVTTELFDKIPRITKEEFYNLNV